MFLKRAFYDPLFKCASKSTLFFTLSSICFIFWYFYIWITAIVQDIFVKLLYQISLSMSKAALAIILLVHKESGTRYGQNFIKSSISI